MSFAQVLVIESNATVRKLIAGTLRTAGFSVAHADASVRAEGLLSELCPALVLLDLTTLGSSIPTLHSLIDSHSSSPSTQWVFMHPASLDSTEALEQFHAASLPKPFTPDRLLSCVRNYIQPETNTLHELPQPHRSSLKPTAPSSLEASTEFESDSSLDAWIECLSAQLTPLLKNVHFENPISSRTLSHLLRQELSDAQLRTFSHDLRKLTPSTRGMASLEGRIDHAPLVETLQMLQIQGQTGTLNIRQDDHVVNICLRDGQVDMAVGEAASAEFLLGRYLIEKGLIGRDELERVLHDDSDKLEKLLGKRLLDQSVISANDLRDALEKQTTDLLCEVLRWDKGTFRFDRETLLPVAELARLELPMQSLLMEGVRRIDEWNVIRHRVPDLGMVFARNNGPATKANTHVTPQERHVLDAIDGKRDVHAIIALTSMSTFDVCKTLNRFVDRGLAKNLSLH